MSPQTQAESIRERGRGRDGRLALAALKQADVRAVEAGTLTKNRHRETLRLASLGEKSEHGGTYGL